MKQVTSAKFKKQYKKLPSKLQKKFKKKLKLLLQDYHHPSLRAKKVKGKDFYEARIDYHYRFTYKIENNKFFLFSIGPHDEGLGKK